MLRLLLIFTCLVALHAQEDVAPIAEQPTPSTLTTSRPASEKRDRTLRPL